MVEYGNLACRIINGIVNAFGKFHAASPYRHTSLRNVICAKTYDIGRSALVLTYQYIAVFLRHLLCHSLRSVIKFLIAVLCRNIVTDLSAQYIVYSIAKRLYQWKEHTSVRHGVSFYEVIKSVRVCLVVIVQTVGTYQLYYRRALHLRLWYV